MGYAEAQYAADTAAKKINTRIDELVDDQFGGETPPIVNDITVESVMDVVTVSVKFPAVVNETNYKTIESSPKTVNLIRFLIDKIRIVGKKYGTPSFDDYDVMKEVDYDDFKEHNEANYGSHMAKATFSGVEQGVWSFVAFTRSSRGIWNKLVRKGCNFRDDTLVKINEVDDRLFGCLLESQNDGIYSLYVRAGTMGSYTFPAKDCVNSSGSFTNVKTRTDSISTSSQATIGNWNQWKWFQKIKPFIVDTNGRAVQQLDPDDFTKQQNGEPSLLASDPTGASLNDYAGVYAWIPKLYEGLGVSLNTLHDDTLKDLTALDKSSGNIMSVSDNSSELLVFSEDRGVVSKNREYYYSAKGAYSGSVSLQASAPGFIDEDGTELYGCWIPCFYGKMQNGHGASWPGIPIQTIPSTDATTLMNSVSNNGNTRIRCFGGPIINLIADVLTMMGDDANGNAQNAYSVGFANISAGPGSGNGPVTLQCYPAGSGFYGADNVGWNKIFHSIVLGSYVNRIIDPYTYVYHNSLYIQNRITKTMDTSHATRVGGLSDSMGKSFGTSSGNYRLGYPHALYCGIGLDEREDETDETIDPNGFGDGTKTNIGLNPIIEPRIGLSWEPHDYSYKFDCDAVITQIGASNNDSPWPVYRLGAYGDGANAGPRMMIAGINGNNDPDKLTQEKNTFACMVLPPQGYEPTIVL